MRLCAIFVLTALALTSARAVTIAVDLELLKDAGGAPLPVTGLVVLTAGVSGTFAGPTPTSFAGGDELVLARWDLSAFATPGVLQETAAGLNLAGAWNTGDPLRVYWYPSLTLASTAPGAGTPYGAYRDLGTLDGSDPWITPAQSDSISLKFFTTDATLLSTGGSQHESTGVARFTVVPEPGTGVLTVCAIVIAAGVRRVRKSG